jgi:hypothetical protein
VFWLLFFAIFRRDQRGETTTLTIEGDGLFDISVTKILKEGLLQPETIFQCLLTIPGTHFSIREETMYFPGKGKQHPLKNPMRKVAWFLRDLFRAKSLYFVILSRFFLAPKAYVKQCSIVLYTINWHHAFIFQCCLKLLRAETD